MAGQRLAALVGAAALALAGCQSPVPEQTPPTVLHPVETPSPAFTAGGTLRWAIREPSALTPPEVADPDGLLVVDALFDSLTVWDDGASRVAPRAAVSWSTLDDGRTWRFRLRKSARWHDGEPVTAHDFVEAWARAVRGEGAGHHLRLVAGYAAVRDGSAERLAGVHLPDASTLEVRLVRPFADFPAVVAHPGLGPVPAHRWRDDVDAERLRPVGNGPFRMTEAWVRGQFVRLAPFPAWRNGPPPHLGEVLFRITDPDTAYLAFQQGRVDVTQVPAGALAEAIGTYGTAAAGRGPGVLRGGAAVLYHLGFVLDSPPFDDVEVRRAVSLAIDRAELAARILEGNVRPARSAVPPAIAGSRALACSTCRHQPGRARAIFAERGITELTLWFNRGGGHEAVARLVREQLADVGVRVVFRTTARSDLEAYLAAIDRGDADWFRFGWAADHPVLDDALYPLLHSTATPRAGGGNLGGYAAADVDALLDEARAALDPVVRRAAYQAAEELALERDQAIVPLFTYRHRVVVSERVSDFRLGPTGLVDLAAVQVHSRPAEQATAG